MRLVHQMISKKLESYDSDNKPFSKIWQFYQAFNLACAWKRKDPLLLSPNSNLLWQRLLQTGDDQYAILLNREIDQDMGFVINCLREIESQKKDFLKEDIIEGDVFALLSW